MSDGNSIYSKVSFNLERRSSNYCMLTGYSLFDTCDIYNREIYADDTAVTKQLIYIYSH